MARYRAGIRTEARIIDATRELLGEVGLDGTTLKAICERAGVRAGSFYNLFESKEEVYIAFITGSSSLASIYVQIAVNGAITHGTLGTRVLRHHQRRLERFSEAMQRADATLDDAEAARRAELLIATLNGLAFRLVLDPRFDFAGHARSMLGSRITG